MFLKLARIFGDSNRCSAQDEVNERVTPLLTATAEPPSQPVTDPDHQASPKPLYKKFLTTQAFFAAVAARLSSRCRIGRAKAIASSAPATPRRLAAKAHGSWTVARLVESRELRTPESITKWGMAGSQSQCGRRPV